MRFILKLRTCTIRCVTYGTAINDFSISVKDPLPDLPIFLPKWITRSMNTLRRKDKVHTEAYNLYFQVRYIGNLYQRFKLFRWTILLLISKFPPGMDNSVYDTLRRIEKVHIEANNLFFQVRYLGKLYQRFYLFLRTTLYLIPNFSEMEKSGWDHATQKRKGSYWILETLPSGTLHMEPLSTILPFSVNDPLPDLTNLFRNG